MHAYYVVGMLWHDDEGYDVTQVVQARDWKQAALEAAAEGLDFQPKSLREIEKRGWNYNLMAVVALRANLPVEEPGRIRGMPKPDDFLRASPRRGRLWVVVGATEAGDTWVAKVRTDAGADDEEAIQQAVDFLDAWRVGKDEPVHSHPNDIYGVVREDVPDERYTIFTPGEPSQTVGRDGSIVHARSVGPAERLKNAF